jgi:hypothetical protein
MNKTDKKIDEKIAAKANPKVNPPTKTAPTLNSKKKVSS